MRRATPKTRPPTTRRAIKEATEVVNAFSKRTPVSRRAAGNAVSTWAGGCLLAALCVTHPAGAQDVSGAANAFQRAQKADISGDHDTAAELYELADSLAPAPEALRSALRARKGAGQLGAAARHAERLLQRYPDDKKSKDLANATLDEAKKKLARIEVHCRPKACGIVVDGAAATSEVTPTHVIYLEPGKHEVSASFGTDRAAPKVTQVKASDQLSFTFDAPPPSATPRPADPAAKPGVTIGADTAVDRGAATASRGLSPWFFVTGAVVTAGLGAATVWSGLDVLSAHDDYKGRESQTAYEDGLDKERRTNIFIGATAVAGVSTIVLAYFTRWSGSSEATTGQTPARLQAGCSPIPGGTAITFGGDF
jgi:hypothetical protein